MILAGVFWLLSTRQLRVTRRVVDQARQFFSLDWLYRSIWILYQLLRRLIDWITAILEGDGGILWAMLLLALLLSLLSRQVLGG